LEIPALQAATAHHAPVAITDRASHGMAPVATPPRWRPDRYDADDDGGAPRPRKKKSQKRQGVSAVLLVGIGLVVVAVPGVTVGLLLLLNNSGDSPSSRAPEKVAKKATPEPRKDAGNNPGDAGAPAPKEQGPAPGKAPNPGVLPIIDKGPGAPPGGNVPPADAQGTKLAGTWWAGNETLQGYGNLRFVFQEGGRAIMHDHDGATPGTYVQNGQEVSLTFYGHVVYRGQITGQQMKGTASNGQRNWTWTLTRRAGNPPAGGLPIAGGPGNPGGFPGMPNPPGGFPGGPFPGGFPGNPNPGGIIGRPNPGGIIGNPNPGGIIGNPNPGGIIGRPNPGGIVGNPNPGGFIGRPNPGGIIGNPNPAGIVGNPNPGGFAGGPNPGGLPGFPGPGQGPGGLPGFPGGRPGG
jgi:hypothetical protein